MRWTVHGERRVYESSWLNVDLADVELADGSRVEHHILRMPRPSVTAVVVNDADEMLLLWRHRFITDTWGWEVPAGWVDPGEDPRDAAAREVREETGYEARHLEPLTTYNALSGISTMRFACYLARDVHPTGATPDVNESERLEWFSTDDVRTLLREGLVPDGPSLTALATYLATIAA